MKNKRDRVINIFSYETILFNLLLIVLGMYFFFLLGEKGYVLSRDSETYINGYYGTTVMPLYIFFIDCLKVLFGTQSYLKAAVLIQGTLAIVVSIFLAKYLQRIFSLKLWQVLIVYILSFLPYAYSLPTHVVTHEIMTEGIAFSIFYLFFIFYFEGIKEMNWLRFGVSAGISMLLIFIRSQLLVLLPILIIGSAVLFVRKYNVSYKKVILFLGMLLTLMIGVFFVIKSANNIYLFRFLDGTQIMDALVGRTIYISDREDIELFQDEDVQGAFEVLHEFADQNGQRYCYNTESGKARFNKMTEGINYITRSSWKLLVDYCEKNNWNYTRSEEFQTDIAITIMLNHMDLFLMNFLELAFPSMVAAIFIQKENIYTLCTFITVILYGIGIFLAVLNRKKRNVILLYLTVMSILLINIILVNILFMGLQRYVVYTFGLYYIILFIMFCNLWIKLRSKVCRSI